MVAFQGQMGMFTRALTYILSHGADGLRQVAEDSVLNANYILRAMEDVLDAPFAKSGPCMHEAIFSDAGLPEGFSTIDIGMTFVSVPRLIGFGAVFVVALLLWALLTLTDLGKAIRAVAKERRGAELSGIDVAHIYAMTFGLGTACLAIAACLLSASCWRRPAVTRCRPSGRSWRWCGVAVSSRRCLPRAACTICRGAFCCCD